MKDDTKSSIIKEALTEYNEILEAASTNAKNKLAEEFPDKLNNLIKEELKNKNKTTKESYKIIDEGKESNKLDETEINKESVMKDQVKETKKVVKETAGSGKPFGDNVKKPETVEEDVKIIDTVGDGDPFDTKAKKTLQTEEFNLTELDDSNVGTALENADELDEILTMEAIENEIANMGGLEEELAGIEANSPSYMEKGNKGIAFDELVNMRNKLDEIIGTLKPSTSAAPVEEMHQGEFDTNQMHQGAYDEKLIDEKPVDEMHQGNFNLDKMHQGQYDNALIDEESPITDDEIESVLGSVNQEEQVEEAHGVTYGARRNSTGRHTPSYDSLSKGEQDQSPEYVQETKKKIDSLIEENKMLTKKYNESKKFKESATSLVESYKSALEKYRNQLREMAIFNTNLSHVNNLLVNESLALTQEDKVRIINDFKQINSIAESQNKYKTFLTEMKGSKKTITESIEDKVSASIQPSSKQKLNEVTAYENNEHINKMKNLIKYAENRGKK